MTRGHDIYHDPILQLSFAYRFNHCYSCHYSDALISIELCWNDVYAVTIRPEHMKKYLVDVYSL